MKPLKPTLRAAVLTAALACASPLSAQTTTTLQTMTSTGTVNDFGPGVITVRAAAAAEPAQYSVTKTTTYVDQTGAPVSMDIVKSGLPVTVYYTDAGGVLTASRVVVNRATTTTTAAPVVEEKRTTTTTTTRKGDDDDD
jgi:hypothetical protein